MKNEIFWKNPGYKTRPELRGDTECDYLIVGGGVTGVSVAYFLAKSGAKNIVLVDKHSIGSGATGKAAGTLVLRGEADLQDLIQTRGRKKAGLLWKGIHAGFGQINKMIEEEKIDCDAELEDTLICGFKGENWSNLYKEHEAEKSIGGRAQLLEGDDLKKELNSNLFTHALLSEAHAISLNPLKFIQGFSQAVERRGVTIYENTEVKKTVRNVAETPHGNIKYKKIIWAIDVDYPSTRIKNLKTTIVVTRPLTDDELVKIGFAKRKKVVWDSKKNERYFNITKDKRLLVGFGGIIVNKNQRKTEPHFYHTKQLRNFIKRLFPYLNLAIEYAWSGHFGVHRHYSKGPFISYEYGKAVIGGAGSQVVCFLAAEHLVNKILGKGTSQNGYF